MYSKTIQEFLTDVREDFENAVIRVLEMAQDGQEDPAEKQSWLESLPAVAEVLELLPEQTKEQCEIVLEAKFATEEKRSDVVLVGTNGARKAMVMIENKRWSGLQEYEPLGECSVWDPFHGKLIDHPSLQVNHYRKTLEYTNQYVQENRVRIYAMVFLQNAILEEKTFGCGPFDPKYQRYFKSAPLFTGEEKERMAAYLAGKLTGGIRGMAEQVYTSPVRYSTAYRQIVKNVFGNREKLREILDEEQIVLFDEIANELNHGQEQKIFLIEGSAGTGKTFLAVALLAYLYQNAELPNLKVRYVEKNRDPRKLLHSEWHVPEQAMMATTSMINRSVRYDCLICDEAHRMMEQVFVGKDDGNFIERFLELCRVAVFFCDEKQSVHVRDYVTKERIYEIAAKNGISPEQIMERGIGCQHRCQSAAHFLSLVEQMLEPSKTENLAKRKLQESDEYGVALVHSPEELFEVIREKNAARGDGDPSRVVAGKGRSYGADWTWVYSNLDYDGEKTIAPLRDSDEKLYTWNFGNYGAKRTFATDEKSVDLVGCIDTSQGIGFEYVGVILAPDLIYNRETKQVEVCVDGHHQTDPHTGGKAMAYLDRQRIERVIKNTYRVLLTRGERGCYLYCCDEALEEYFAQFICFRGEAESDVEERKEGVVSYIAPERKYAYIESDGESYIVSGGTIRNMWNVEDILVKGTPVSFTVYNGTRKKYANSIMKTILKFE